MDLEAEATRVLVTMGYGLTAWIVVYVAKHYMSNNKYFQNIFWSSGHARSYPLRSLGRLHGAHEQIVKQF